MKDIRNLWAGRVFKGLKSLAESKSLDTSAFSQESLVLQKPPKPEMGDIAIPLFPFAKVFRTAPQKISQDLADYINSRYGTGGSSGRAAAAGPYINIFIDLPQLTLSTIRSIEELSSEYGNTELYKNKKIMIEFSCPNTNKPLHLGHLRNDAIGESVARICKANGADVRKVNLINDRGVHICKSMLAYREFGEGSTPEKENIKSDHFVGKYYVKFSQWAKEDPSADKRAQDMLKAWEAGDPEVTALWRKMNAWTVEGIEETYRKTGVSFDDTYYESRTYAEGREEVLKGLEQGTFYKDEEGTVWADLSEIDLDKKVLLRRDGTSLYLTQDIGTAITR
ncbi:MAG: arginine--tRNA ligase, partial [Spirochaetia bacterium]|nr:arginine--tRNA ligase [Spirochaetia bacterium]